MALPVLGALLLRGAGVAGRGGLAGAIVGSALRAAGTPDVDVSLIGDRSLQRKLNRLDRRVARRIVARALRRGAKRAQARVVRNLSGAPVQVRTGRTRQAFAQAKIRAGKAARGLVRVGVTVPTRDEFGIDSGDPSFYPYAIEYGHGSVPAYPYIRPAVDDHYRQEIAIIGNEIGAGIEREARR